MSLRVRLTLQYSALTGGILLIFGGLIFALVNGLLYTQVDNALLSTYNEMVTGWRVAPDGAINPKITPKFNLSENIYYQFWDTHDLLRFTSPGVRLLGGSLDQAGLQAGHNIFRDVYAAVGHLRVLSVPLEAGERPIGTLQIAADMGIVDTTRNALLFGIVVTFLASMVFAASVAWLSTGRALAPLGAITASALKISRADDLSRRIPNPVPGDDEVGQLIDAFNDTLGRLEQLFTSQQRFLADVSHELRTPLTVIKGNVNLMRRIGQADDESLSSIEEEADRLTRLVGDLLLEAQAETGRLPLNFAPLEMDTLLLEVFKEMRVLARDRLTVKLTEIDQIQVNGDRDRLKQVLINLISNAIKYTPNGGEVYLSLSRVGDTARIIVRDTGPGIPSEDLPHIFERFYRAEKSRTRSKVGGFGLGLSIAFWIVNNHGGKIEVDSAEGKGTTFCIYLPIYNPPAMPPVTD